MPIVSSSITFKNLLANAAAAATAQSVKFYDNDFLPQQAAIIARLWPELTIQPTSQLEKAFQEFVKARQDAKVKVSAEQAQRQATIDETLPPEKEWGLNNKLAALKKLYYSELAALKTIQEDETKAFTNLQQQSGTSIEGILPPATDPEVIKQQKANLKKLADEQLAALQGRQAQEEQLYFADIRQVYMNALMEHQYYDYDRLDHQVRSHKTDGKGTISDLGPAINNGQYKDRHGEGFTIEDNKTSFDFTAGPELTRQQKEEKLLDRMLAVRHGAQEKRRDEIAKLSAEGKFAEIEKLPPLTIKITAQVKDRRPGHAGFTDEPSQTRALLSLEWRACIRAGYEPSHIQGYAPDAADYKFAHEFAAKTSYCELEQVSPALREKLNLHADKTRSAGIAPILTEDEIIAIKNLIKTTEFRMSTDPAELKNTLDALEKLHGEFETIRRGLGDLLLGKKISDEDGAKPGKDFSKAVNFVRDLRIDRIQDPELRKALRTINTDPKGFINRKITQAARFLKKDAGQCLLDLLTPAEIQKLNEEFSQGAFDAKKDFFKLAGCLSQENRNTALVRDLYLSAIDNPAVRQLVRSIKDKNANPVSLANLLTLHEIQRINDNFRPDTVFKPATDRDKLAGCLLTEQNKAFFHENYEHSLEQVKVAESQEMPRPDIELQEMSESDFEISGADSVRAAESTPTTNDDDFAIEGNEVSEIPSDSGSAPRNE